MGLQNINFLLLVPARIHRWKTVRLFAWRKRGWPRNRGVGRPIAISLCRKILAYEIARREEVNRRHTSTKTKQEQTQKNKVGQHKKQNTPRNNSKNKRTSHPARRVARCSSRALEKETTQPHARVCKIQPQHNQRKTHIHTHHTVLFSVTDGSFPPCAATDTSAQGTADVKGRPFTDSRVSMLHHHRAIVVPRHTCLCGLGRSRQMTVSFLPASLPPSPRITPPVRSTGPGPWAPPTPPGCHPLC